jgi:hypothetical protein
MTPGGTTRSGGVAFVHGLNWISDRVPKRRAQSGFTAEQHRHAQRIRMLRRIASVRTKGRCGLLMLRFTIPALHRRSLLEVSGYSSVLDREPQRLLFNRAGVTDAAEPWFRRALHLARWSLQRREALTLWPVSACCDGILAIPQKKVAGLCRGNPSCADPALGMCRRQVLCRTPLTPIRRRVASLHWRNQCRRLPLSLLQRRLYSGSPAVAVKLDVVCSTALPFTGCASPRRRAAWAGGSTDR